MLNPDRPGLGIVGRTVSEEIAYYLGIPAMGVMVSMVAPGGSAYLAGILPGDVITGFAGEPVFLMEELVASIRRHEIGDVVEIRLLRDGEPMAFNIELRAFIN